MSVRVRESDPERSSNPFGARFWRSPLRGPWLTSVLGRVLLWGLPVVMVTGLLANAAWDPRLGMNIAGQGRSLGPFDFYLFSWPAHPGWLYAVNQGLHVSIGMALIPVVVAKQWSVLPRLFTWPPARNLAHALERLSLIFLVGGIYFEIVTGILFIEYWFPFKFDFDAAHYYGAWVFFGAFALHVTLKLGRMREALRTRREAISIASLAQTAPEPPDGLRDSLVPVAPGPATMTRRALLGTVAAGSVLLGGMAAAQDVGGPTRPLALMLPRTLTAGTGPNDFPVNGTFASLGLDSGAIGKWRMRVQGSGGQRHELEREELLKMPQYTYSLVLACREGWSTRQRWTGVRLRDLAAAVGMSGSLHADISALDGAVVTLATNQVSAEDTLIALGVNGVPLSLDHGYPARLIIPGDVAVNCLKWVNGVSFNRVDPA